VPRVMAAQEKHVSLELSSEDPDAVAGGRLVCNSDPELYTGIRHDQTPRRMRGQLPGEEFTSDRSGPARAFAQMSVRWDVHHGRRQV
jgi:hypothetical protein